MRGVVNIDARRQRRPVAGGEASATEELREPRPGVAAEAGDVEAEPGTATGHIAFEGLPLRRRVRHVVQPDDDADVAEGGVAHRVPVAGRSEGIVAGAGARAEGAHRLLGEEVMIELAPRGEKRQHLGARCGGFLLAASAEGRPAQRRKDARGEAGDGEHNSLHARAGT